MLYRLSSALTTDSISLLIWDLDSGLFTWGGIFLGLCCVFVAVRKVLVASPSWN